MNNFWNQVPKAKKIYIKPPLTHEEMITLLENRGLILDKNRNIIQDHIQHTWYYRLSSYFKSYQKSDDTFYPKITFSIVRDTYIFDRKLRLHTLDAIEKIEVSLKANINDIMSIKSWCLWYLDKTNFDLIPRRTSNKTNKRIPPEPVDIYSDLVKIINKISSSWREMVKFYQQKYDPKELPSRILFQELTIGEISNLYNILPQTTRQEIADIYWVYETDLRAWIRTLVNIRNICAHHWRLWNRRYVFKVRANDTKFKTKFQKFTNRRWYTEVIPNYFNLTLIIVYLLRRINKNFDRLGDLRKILKSYKNKYNKRMGLYSKRYKNI